MSQGHHRNRMTNEPGEPMDWHTHQEIHRGEEQALKDLGIRGDAFNRGFGNVIQPLNLPPRRCY